MASLVHQKSKSASTVKKSQLPPGINVRNITILRRNDWERIQNTLNKKDIEMQNERQKLAEREAVKQKSTALWKNWTNTIAGARQKKLESRKLREAKEENERLEIDIEEAKFQAQQRKKAIEKAKMQQYYQTDRVKNFHSALLLTEVIKEREAQIQLARMQANEKERDEALLEMWHRKMEESKQLDFQNAKKRFESAQENADHIKMQIAQNRHKQENETSDRLAEADQIKKLTIEYEKEKQRLSELTSIDKTQLADDYKRQIVEKQKLQQLERMQHEQEDEECRMFAAAKRKMMKLRAKKEAELNAEKMTRLDRIRDRLNDQMQAKKDDEDSRVLRAVEQISNKRADEEREKFLKQKAMQDSIIQHRLDQVELNKQRMKEEENKEKELLEMQREVDNIFFKQEDEKQRRRKEEAKDLNAHRLNAMEEQRNEKEAQDSEERAFVQRNMEVQALEEEQFQAYARRVINHMEKTGRNVYPLKKAARDGIGGGYGPKYEERGIRPNYTTADKLHSELPNWKRDSTEDTKKAIGLNAKTSRRLGFNFA